MLALGRKNGEFGAGAPLKFVCFTPCCSFVDGVKLSTPSKLLNGTVKLSFWCKKQPKQGEKQKKCAGRESNPGLVRGRDVYYHCTTGACVRLRNRESNPGHLRDRQRCYQLHHIG